MKALTISQPYASLIASGDKWIENRFWSTHYRGLLAIHAGKGSQYLYRHELAQYPTGAIVAVATLLGCVDRHRLLRNGNSRRLAHEPALGGRRTWAELAAHPHAEGPYCWVLADVTAIEPVPCGGAQSLWTPSPEIIDRLGVAVAPTGQEAIGR